VVEAPPERFLSRPERTRLRRKAARRRRALVGLGAFAGVLVILFGTVFGYLWFLNGEIHRVGVKHLHVTPTSGPDMGTQNILLVGSTSRCALDGKQTNAFGSCAAGLGVNSDVVMVLHLDPNRHSLSILSIPRDLFVPNARTSGPGKIDAALADGPSQLVDVVEQNFGIPIQHYAELNFDSFQGIVNALGGVNMYFPMPVHDAYSALDVTTPGCQTLNGFQALAVVRARHLQYRPPSVTTSYWGSWPSDPESDLSRIRRDHEFLRVLASKLKSRGLGNPITDQGLVASVAPQLQVDSSLSLSDMVSLVLTFHTVDVNSAPQLTLPVRVSSSMHYYYNGYDYGNIEFPSVTEDIQAVDQFLGVSPSTDTMTGAQLPAPSSVQVSVLNGSGAYDQASNTATALGALGFNVVGTGDTRAPGAQVETVVRYAPLVPGAEAAAEVVAHAMSGAAIMTPGPTANGAPVTVVTGTDFSVNPPQPAAGAAPAPSAPSTPSGSAVAASHSSETTSPSGTSASGTSSSSGVFGAPSQTVEPAAPFDPRSCTPLGGPGP
jgi:LCP family protein required for cell wall assembly